MTGVQTCALPICGLCSRFPLGGLARCLDGAALLCERLRFLGVVLLEHEKVFEGFGNLVGFPVLLDVDELLRVLRIEPLADPVVRPVPEGNGWFSYAAPDAPFTFRRLELDGTTTIHARRRTLVLCTDGNATALGQGETLYLAEGSEVTVSGRARLFVAD